MFRQWVTTSYLSSKWSITHQTHKATSYNKRRESLWEAMRNFEKKVLEAGTAQASNWHHPFTRTKESWCWVLNWHHQSSVRPLSRNTSLNGQPPYGEATYPSHEHTAYPLGCPSIHLPSKRTSTQMGFNGDSTSRPSALILLVFVNYHAVGKLLAIVASWLQEDLGNLGNLDTPIAPKRLPPVTTG